VKAREEEAVVRRLKTDLHSCVGYIQEPKLFKDSIKAMYQKHVHEDMVNSLHERVHVVILYAILHCPSAVKLHCTRPDKQAAKFLS